MLGRSPAWFPNFERAELRPTWAVYRRSGRVWAAFECPQSTIRGANHAQCDSPAHPPTHLRAHIGHTPCYIPPPTEPVNVRAVRLAAHPSHGDHANGHVQ